MLEFPSWKQARAWSYLGNFAIAEGLEANGCECVVLPAMAGVPLRDRDNWLAHARALFEGERFDQVWLWLVHQDYDPDFLAWVRSLAPVVVGWVGESLEHTAAEVALMPRLAHRQRRVEQQLASITHALTVDERDAEYLQARKVCPALWLPMAVPARTIIEPEQDPLESRAAIFGTLYGERARLTAQGLQGGFLERPPPPENATPWAAQFEQAHQLAQHYLRTVKTPTRHALAAYVHEWRTLRSCLHDAWSAGLARWPAVVNLPSIGKVYTSRVVETMAAGRAVVSWRVPGRPRNLALFLEESEILLYDPEDSLNFERQVRRIVSNPGLGQCVAARARATLWRHHTVEHRMRQVLRWIDSQQLPLYATPATRDPALCLERLRSALSLPPETEAVSQLDDSPLEAGRRQRLVSEARRQGDSEAELDHLVDAVLRFPDTLEFRTQLQSCLARRHCSFETKTVYGMLLRTHPQHRELSLDAAEALVTIGEAASARQCIQQLSPIGGGPAPSRQHSLELRLSQLTPQADATSTRFTPPEPKQSDSSFDTSPTKGFRT